MSVFDELSELADKVESSAGGCGGCIARGEDGSCKCEDSFDCTDAICAEVSDRLREIVEHGECDATTVSAYDLLPDDDREALAWVREMGGIGHVKALYYLGFELLDALCIAEDGEPTNADCTKARQELDKRLMPECMEWPRFEDDVPVKLGDIALIDGEADMVEAVQLWIHGRPVIYGDGGIQQLERGQRVKRPAVLAADGRPLRIGDNVWSTAGEFDGVRTVEKVRTDPDEMPYAMFKGSGEPLSCLCSLLTHERPVLDADGVPIKVGDEVWSTRGSESGTVVYAYPPGDDGQPSVKVGATWHHAVDLTHRAPVIAAEGKPLRIGERAWNVHGGGPYEITGIDHKTGHVDVKCRMHDGELVWGFPASELRHEQPDSWERLYLDMDNGRMCQKDFVRRARKLAGDA